MSRFRTRNPLISVTCLLGLAGYLIFMLAERFPELAGPVVKFSSLQQVSGPVTRIRDGDTIEVNGIPVRFGSLDCAERGTADGRTATRQMQTLASGRYLTCYLNGRESYDRKIGSCRFSDDTDLAYRMIKGGYCNRYW